MRWRDRCLVAAMMLALPMLASGCGDLPAVFIQPPQALPERANWPVLQDVVAISAGWSHTCALLRNGVVTCWGDNGEGQIGTGLGTRTYRPAAPAGLDDVVVALAAGNTHTCALLTSGTVACWGNNNAGQLGDGTADESATPVLVSFAVQHSD